MTNIPVREIEFSPLGGRVSREGCTVQIHIYRFAGSDDEWTLEVVDHDDGHTVWENTFSTDQEAYEAFEQALNEDGIRSFVDEPVKH
ncbi:hypothetical protein [Methylobacterium sp. GC_Met_2]|uniref:hypothetical protein n=1 Tax=Methylobacterium sp. GC_Met_2 TaxID=2937376 RepID=UPI00226B47B6|nr:hypothetical protein [Methylobacterium sp. GC_Met_2]